MLTFILQGGNPPHNSGAPITLQSSFRYEAEASIIYEFLQSKQPLPNGLYYKIYKDSQYKVNLSFIELTQSFKDLNLKSGMTLYVKRDPDIM